MDPDKEQALSALSEKFPGSPISFVKHEFFNYRLEEPVEYTIVILDAKKIGKSNVSWMDAVRNIG